MSISLFHSCFAAVILKILKSLKYLQSIPLKMNTKFFCVLHLCKRILKYIQSIPLKSQGKIFCLYFTFVNIPKYIQSILLQVNTKKFLSLFYLCKWTPKYIQKYTTEGIDKSIFFMFCLFSLFDYCKDKYLITYM